jgi:hypothetical protein
MQTTRASQIEIGAASFPNCRLDQPAYPKQHAGQLQQPAFRNRVGGAPTRFAPAKGAQNSTSAASIFISYSRAEHDQAFNLYRGLRPLLLQDQGSAKGLGFAPLAKIDIVALWAAARREDKVVASFVGRVETVNADSACVTLRDEATGESLESKCDLEFLKENGIGAGDEFRCEVIRAAGTTSTRLSKLPHKAVPKQRVHEVLTLFRDRWNFDERSD